MSTPVLRLIGKPDCHLCADARAVLAEVCTPLGIGWEEVSILDDPALADEFWEKIPVVQLDGRTVDFWRIDGPRLAALVSEAINR